MTISIRFDGQTLHGRDGQTVAGILLGSGVRTWRTAAGAERGLFCGIGVCQDCVVTVNGTVNVRACQRTATDGDIVERETR